MATDQTIRHIDIGLTTDPVLIEEIEKGTVKGRPVGHPNVALQFTNRFLWYSPPLLDNKGPKCPFFDLSIVITVHKEDPRITQMREEAFMLRREVPKTYEEIQRLTQERERMITENESHERYLCETHAFFSLYRKAVKEVESLKRARNKMLQGMIEEKEQFLKDHEQEIVKLVNENPYPHADKEIRRATWELRRKEELIKLWRSLSIPYPSAESLEGFLQEKGLWIRDRPQLFRNVQNSLGIFSVESTENVTENTRLAPMTIPFRVFEAISGRNHNKVVYAQGFQAFFPGAKNIIGGETGGETLLVYDEKEEQTVLLPFWVCQQVIYNIDLIRGERHLHRLIVQMHPHWSHRNLNPEDRVDGKEVRELPMPSLDTTGENPDETQSDFEDENFEVETSDDGQAPESSRVDEDTPVVDASASPTM